MKVTVNVTEEDIENGNVSKPYGCPIYLALHKLFSEAKNLYIGVHGHCLDIGDFTWYFNSQIPYQLNDEHYSHADFTKVGLNPFTFTMDNVPDKFKKYMQKEEDIHTVQSNNNDIQYMQKDNGNVLIKFDNSVTCELTFEQLEKIFQGCQERVNPWINI